MADSDSNKNDIYITNKSSNIENELVTYLEEKKENRKINRIYLNSIK
jgi:hypothetical protein